MEQLGLALAPRIPYESKNFLVHQGVSDCLTRICSIIDSKNFGTAFVEGARRSGKTHCSIKVGELAVQRGCLPRYTDGESFATFIGEGMGALQHSPLDVVIVDEAEKFFEDLRPGNSGPFVHFIESLRRVHAKIIYFSSVPLESFPCDAHCISRIRPGIGLSIMAPSEEDMPLLIKLMAAQRGVSLKERHIQFVLKRIGREISLIERYLDRVMHLSQVLGKKIQYPLLSDAV